MRAAQLRHRIVAVADQHALVKGPRFFQRRAIVRRSVWPPSRSFQAQLRIAEKLVQESPPQTFRRAAVAREQRARDFLRQLETEGRAIEIGKKGTETILFFGSEFRGHAWIVLNQ